MVEQFKESLLSNGDYDAYEDFVYKIDLASHIFANTSPEYKNEILSRYYDLKASGQCHSRNANPGSSNEELTRTFPKYFDLINSG